MSDLVCACGHRQDLHVPGGGSCTAGCSLCRAFVRRTRLPDEVPGIGPLDTELIRGGMFWASERPDPEKAAATIRALCGTLDDTCAENRVVRAALDTIGEVVGFSCLYELDPRRGWRCSPDAGPYDGACWLCGIRTVLAAVAR